jgi:DNA-binding NarL/FixJ family response regulator
MVVSDLIAREQAPNSAPPTIRMIVADDSSVYRDGLANLLTMQRDFHVLGTADTPSSAADMIRDNKPDIVLLGWTANSQGCQRVFSAIQDTKSMTRVIMLSDDQAKEDFVEAVRLGCCGIVPKRTSTELLLKSIRKVHAGEFWLDRVTTAEVIRKLAKKGSNGANAPSARLGVRDQSGALSQREREIVVLVAQGFKNKEMAERMFISEQTVKNHLHNIFDKLGVSDRLELALYAIHHNLHEG